MLLCCSVWCLWCKGCVAIFQGGNTRINRLPGHQLYVECGLLTCGTVDAGLHELLKPRGMFKCLCRFIKGSATNAVTVVSGASKQQQQQQEQQPGRNVPDGGGAFSVSELTEVQRQSVDRLCLWGYAPEACAAALQVARQECDAQCKGLHV